MDDFGVMMLMDENLNINVFGNVVDGLVHPLPLLDIEGRVVRRRNENYFEIIIPTYSDIQFFQHFRMSRQACEELVHIVGNNLANPNRMAPLRKKVLYTIWVLSKQESFLATSDRFNIPVSTAHGIFKDTIHTIAGLIPEFIIWPNEENYQATATIFHHRSRGFPGIIAAIDGCHIPIKQPVGNEVDYYNRKGFHSLILQGTCDHKGKFIDIYIGSPGRMHDARVFRNSILFEKLTDPVNPIIPRNFHIVGDAAYPLMKNVMTPFRDTGHPTQAQTTYNVKLSTVRSTIERAFGLVKGKFRRLKYLDIADIELGNNMIGAACVLHNFLIDHNEQDDIVDALGIEEAQQQNVIQEYEDRNVFAEAEAVHKRNAIVALF